ncbi:response regulator [Vibrio sp. ZSDE26]|uniref:histidine kinase n=1 Tax=Vibrio amylolyticus TaxID=2847292 RepID=A0A9X1XJT6_9VIBR|nr:ATP-binding protein [Vibrio amylolyticus]MCK6262963.1 response regulator [Vibrio amylolyticus]
MLKFDKKNGMHLFSLFILLGTCLFAVVSFIFIQKQAEDSAKLMVKESNAGRFTTISNYTKEFLNSHEQTLSRMVVHPSVTASTLQGVADEGAFKDKLRQLEAIDIESYFNVYDFVGESIYSEFNFSPEVSFYLKLGVADETLLDKVTYSFFKSDGMTYVLLTSPILYNDLPEGLGVYVSRVDDDRLQLGLSSDGNYWVGIIQSQLNWEMSAPTGWETQTERLEGTSLAVSFALSPLLFIEAQQSLFESLFVGVSLATIISFISLFILGRKVLVSPYQQLYQSEQRLIANAEKLKQQQEKSALLVKVAKYMRDAVVFTDKNIKITWVNNAFEKLTGYKYEEVVGKNPGALLQGKLTDKETKTTIKKAITERQSAFFEIVNYSKQGIPYWVEIALTPLFDATGYLEGFMAVERDVTHRVELEASLRQKAIEAESANVAKSQFLASMSHELRTPMNGVLGMGGILKTTDLTKEQQGYVNTLLLSGEHMVSVLNDILDFSKVEAGKLEIVERSFFLSVVVDKVVSMYEPLCKEKGLGFTYETPKQQGEIMLYSDEKRIVQVLQNLLGNAYKFTLNGEVTFALQILGESDNATLSVSVRDTGIGIEKSKLGDIFDPFIQAESDNTRSYGGTGLGLAICQEIVLAMGGEIRVESELGLGSQFFVDIPIKYEYQKRHSYMKEIESFDGTGLVALIVEDNRVNTILLKTLLELRGFECEAVENGQLAIDITENKAFDCIFMDNHMPVMDGIESAKAITRRNDNNNRVIIGCTADVFEETRIAMLNSGCVEVLTKPINNYHLDEILHQRVGNKYAPKVSSL